MMTKPTEAALKVTALEEAIEAKRLAKSRFRASAAAAADAAATAARDQAAALVAGDQQALDAAAAAEQTHTREARNAAAAADLVAADVAAIAAQLAEARKALAAEVEADRVEKIRAALADLALAIADPLKRFAAVAREREVEALGANVARAVGVGMAGGFLGGRGDWKAETLVQAVQNAAAELLPSLPSVSSESWDGIEIGEPIAIAALRPIAWALPGGNTFDVPAGICANCPALFAEQFIALGVAERVSEGPLDAQSIASRSSGNAPWRTSIRPRSARVYLGHPSRWPNSVDGPIVDREQTSPPGGVTHAMARSAAAAR